MQANARVLWNGLVCSAVLLSVPLLDCLRLHRESLDEQRLAGEQPSLSRNRPGAFRSAGCSECGFLRCAVSQLQNEVLAVLPGADRGLPLRSQFRGPLTLILDIPISIILF